MDKEMTLSNFKEDETFILLKYKLVTRYKELREFGS